MKVRLLPSTAGPKQKPQLLTSFVVDDSVAIDAGSLALSLDGSQSSAIRNVVITHSHADHTALLPIFVAEAYTVLTEPVVVHATDHVISDLRKFVFNDHIWPDFEKITLSGTSVPSLEYRVIEPHVTATIAHLKMTPIPVNHTVPCVGLLVDDGNASILFTSDTYTTDEIWRCAGDARNLKAVFVDVSFPNELEELAAASRHFTPRALAADLEKLARDIEIFAVHIKPTNRDSVVVQLGELGDNRIYVAEADRVYEW